MKLTTALLPLLFLSSLLASPSHPHPNLGKLHKRLRSTHQRGHNVGGGLKLRGSESRRSSQPTSLQPRARAAHSGHSALEKRQTFTGRATYYTAGQGACGGFNSNSDFIVALNQNQYGSGGYCYQTITISYGNKHTQAQIVDECPGCPYGGLDMSPGLFNYFASESVGVIQVSWSFGGGEPAPTTSSSVWEAPTSTSTSEWVAPSTLSSDTSVWVAPTTASTTPLPSTTAPPAVPSTTTTTTAALNSTLSLGNGTTNGTLPSASSNSSSSPLASTTGTSSTFSDSPQGTLNVLSQLVLSLGGIVVAAAQGQVSN